MVEDDRISILMPSVQVALRFARAFVAVLGLAFALSACSSFPELPGPASYLGDPDNHDGSGTFPVLGNTARPQVSATSSERRAIISSLVADAHKARYTGEALRGDMDVSAAAPTDTVRVVNSGPASLLSASLGTVPTATLSAMTKAPKIAPSASMGTSTAARSPRGVPGRDRPETSQELADMLFAFDTTPSAQMTNIGSVDRQTAPQAAVVRSKTGRANQAQQPLRGATGSTTPDASRQRVAVRFDQGRPGYAVNLPRLRDEIYRQKLAESEATQPGASESKTAAAKAADGFAVSNAPTLPRRGRLLANARNGSITPKAAAVPKAASVNDQGNIMLAGYQAGDARSKATGSMKRRAAGFGRLQSTGTSRHNTARATAPSSFRLVENALSKRLASAWH